MLVGVYVCMCGVSVLVCLLGVCVCVCVCVGVCWCVSWWVGVPPEVQLWVVSCKVTLAAMPPDVVTPPEQHIRSGHCELRLC